jgi:hypothetical protein
VRAGPVLLYCSDTAPGTAHRLPRGVLVARIVGSEVRRRVAVKAVKPLQVLSVTDSPAPSASMNLWAGEWVGECAREQAVRKTHALAFQEHTIDHG